MSELKNVNNEKLISIIVPVYNSEQYLDELFDSLLAQGLSYDEYEIICVNDGSTDDSLKILEKYAQKYPCIRVVSQENKKQAAARNNGLKISTGRYVWFVDSDDYIDKNAFKFIVSIMDENNIDELTVGLKMFSDGNEIHTYNEKQYTYSPLKKIPQLATCSGVKVFRRSIIEKNQIEWNANLQLCDDTLFIYQFELYSKKNIAIDTPAYYYRQRLDSTSHAHNETVIDKHLYSSKLLGEEYVRIYEQSHHNLTEKQKKNLKTRINLCTQTVLYDLAIKGDETLKNDIIEELKKNKRYPYNYIWWNLRPKISLNRSVYDILMFVFPNENMYRFLGKYLKKLYDKKHG